MKRVESIQVLRGLAFLAVFLYHAQLIPNGGNYGVSVFFLLSGFLLEYRNYDKNSVLDDAVYPAKNSLLNSFYFAISHIKKLYPLHIVTMIIAIPLLLVRTRGMHYLNILFRVVVNIFLIQSWFPWASVRYSMNNLSWFLSCMFLFYILYPAIHIMIAKWDFKKKMHAFVFSVCAMLCVGATVNCLWQSHNTEEIVKGLTYNFPLYRLGDFFFGCLLGNFYQIMLKKATIINERFTLIGWTFAEAIAITVSVLIIVTDWNQALNTTEYLWFMPVANLIPSGILIWLFMECKGAITRSLSRVILLVKLGDISGEAYLIHELVLIYIGIIFGNYFHIWGGDGYILLFVEAILSFIITIAASKIWRSFQVYFFEKIDIGKIHR